jgi:hypothetical protein
MVSAAQRRLLANREAVRDHDRLGDAVGRVREHGEGAAAAGIEDRSATGAMGTKTVNLSE